LSVVDASAYVDVVVGLAPVAGPAVNALTGRIDAPAIFPAEVMSGLRGLLVAGHISDRAAAEASTNLTSARIQLHPFLPYAKRVWDLRANLTVYDAWYVAIAEALGQPLVTGDRAILRAPGIRCPVIDARSS